MSFTDAVNFGEIAGGNFLLLPDFQNSALYQGHLETRNISHSLSKKLRKKMNNLIREISFYLMEC